MGKASFDDGVSENPKILTAGPVAAWLWFCSVLYSRRALTDGFIPKAKVPSLVLGLKHPFVVAEKLVAVGLWEIVVGGYLVHDYHHHNPSKRQVQEYQAMDRDRKQRKRRYEAGVSDPPSDLRVHEMSGLEVGHSKEDIQGTGLTRAHAGGKSESKSTSESASEREDLDLSEESARETSDYLTPTEREVLSQTALPPVWRARSTQNRGLVGNHTGCYPSPACGRGLCVPSWLGGQWAAQFPDPEAADVAIRAFVSSTLASLPAGPVGDKPKEFWLSAWERYHGTQRAKSGARSLSAIGAAPDKYAGLEEHDGD